MFNQNAITGTSGKDNRLLICDAYALMCHNTEEKICHYLFCHDFNRHGHCVKMLQKYLLFYVSLKK